VIGVVIVGGGHAGVQAAVKLVELGHRDGIVLIDQEGELPYERPPLSKGMLGAEPVPSRLRKAEFYADKGIELRCGRAVAVHRDRREVELASGERVRFGRLILATGSRPRTLAVPGADLPGVLLLKTLADARALRQELLPGRRLVVVGAGYIGLEVAAAATKAGCKVTVLEAQDRVMARVTSEPVSRYFEALHRAAGARFEFGASVSRIEGAGRVQRVLTAADDVHPADVVVVGIGVRPHQGLAEAAGIACADGVLVDRHARTSDPGVYAVGDVSRVVSPGDPRGVRLESVQSAVTQAVAAATHIVTGATARAEVPWFWTIQHGVRLQTAGLARPGDVALLRGDYSDGRFSVLYLRDGRLVAIDAVGSLKDFIPAKKLIAAGARVDPDLVADASVKLGRAHHLLAS
jgi:3-phenylpropionate/trans-cinnamate dioxygenase ferredoxin reductase component